MEALITSAYPLDSGAAFRAGGGPRAALQAQGQAAGHVDATLIGGVRMQVGDEVIDGSVRGKLAAMAVALTK